MSKLGPVSDISTLGETRTLAVSSSTSRIVLTSTPGSTGPKTFLLLATEDCYVRQGRSNVNADSGDFLLLKDTYVRITCQSENDNYVAAIRVTDDGSLYVTENSAARPGTDVEVVP